jgi:NAD(P)-dependent dehydrogenase (short-subunit alcohol dehydrogenase family)
VTESTLDFAGQNVIVTGASGGIGRATARLFARHGAGVIVHYHENGVGAEETLRSLPSGPHRKLSADLRNSDSVRQFVDSAVGAMGRIDVLVNNAGIYEEHPILSVSYDAWRQSWNRVLNTNLVGPANLTYCVVQHMKENGAGRIVNVSSRGAFRGEPKGPAYGASKAGLNAMGQSLAKSLGGSSIFVFTVAPGFVETDMAAETLSGPQGDFLRNESPLGRVAKPEEVAWTVLLLAAPGSEFLTGCIVDVNGASYLRT